MTPLTKFWATISQEIEPEISCGLLEKEACQLIEIDKPLFRQSQAGHSTGNGRPQLVEKALLQGVPAAAAAGIKLNPSFPAACTSEMTPLTKDSPTFSWAPTKTTVSLGAQGKLWFSWERRSSGGNEYPGLHGYKRSAACDDDIEDCLSCCLSLVRSRSYNSSSQTVHPSEASTAPAAPQAGPGSPVRRRFHRLPCFK